MVAGVQPLNGTKTLSSGPRTIKPHAFWDICCASWHQKYSISARPFVPKVIVRETLLASSAPGQLDHAVQLAVVTGWLWLVMCSCRSACSHICRTFKFARASGTLRQTVRGSSHSTGAAIHQV